EYSLDAIVDVHDNLHINTAVDAFYSPGGVDPYGYWGYFDIYTTDGGNTWKAHLLSIPDTIQGVFGSGNFVVNEYNRNQASSTIWGDKLFFSWFNTDQNVYGTIGN